MNLKTVAKPIRWLVSRLPLPGSTAGPAVGHDELSNYVANSNWANVDPTKYLYAGTRGISRGMEEAHLVWQRIPESLRGMGPDEVAKHLDGLVWRARAGYTSDAIGQHVTILGNAPRRPSIALTREPICRPQRPEGESKGGASLGLAHMGIADTDSWSSTVLR